MKKQIIALVVIISCGLSANLYAQRVGLGLSVNIGAQPVWGPVGYDHVDYYYIPDIDAYYSVPLAQYTFFDDGRWVTSPYLPPRYRDFDLYHAYKVVINEPHPWFHNDRYHSKYAHFRGMHNQAVIRDSRDSRYYANPGHPMHNQWHGDPHRGEVRHEGGGHYGGHGDYGGHGGHEDHGGHGGGHEDHGGHGGHEDHDRH